LTPLADQFPATSAEAYAQELYPLGLTVDDQTWTVELTHHVPDELLFGDGYAFLTGSSPALKTYFENYAEWVAERYDHLFPQGVCEIACNDGTLLQHFNHTRHLGIDPAKPAITEAKRKGLSTAHMAFDNDTAHDIEEPFGVVIANNVAAHASSLEDFLAGVAYLIRDGGVGIIEFQYVGDLLSDALWTVVYHEHRRFLSLTSFMAACPDEMHVVDVLRTPTQGGSLRVVVNTTSGNPSGAVLDLLEKEAWLCRLDTYTSLQGRVDYQVDRLWSALENLGTMTLYGAPAKATTLVHYAGLVNMIDYAEDLTPGKIDRYLPGTDILVVKPGTHSRPSAYLVAIDNYLSSTLSRESTFLADGGRFVLPNGKVI
jgi:hypothetical protein